MNAGINITKLSRLLLVAVVTTLVSVSVAAAPATSADQPTREQVDQMRQEVPQPPRPQARIVGGWPTDTGKWPSIVSLVTRENLIKGKFKPIRSAYWGHFCGGVLITPTWVLTAAHCSPSGILDDVVVGRTDLKRPGQGERILIRDDYSHPQHSLIDNQNDFALVKLARPVRKARPLGLSRLGGNPAPGAQAEVAGWGADHSVTPNVLHETVVEIQDDQVCSDAYYDSFFEEPGYFPDTMLCAGVPAGGRDSCQGDSGGPLMSGGRLVGLVSFGTGCGLVGYPGVYARVQRAVPWIKRVIESHKPGYLFNKRPIREKKGWAPKFVAQFGTTFVEWGDINMLYWPWIAANRYVREPEFRLNGSSDGDFYCPGWVGTYPFDLDLMAHRPDQRCQFGQGSWTSMPGLYGGRAAEASGWGDSSCPPLSLRAQIGGSQRQVDFADCDHLFGRSRSRDASGLTRRPVITPQGMGWEISQRVVVP